MRQIKICGGVGVAGWLFFGCGERVACFFFKLTLYR